ncbi:hypothetical protein J8F10_19915 [Gemmata sp. G18]|uniref:Uncharacterized protein n=1 Tax=Gemmata palustris TaxID=2822762 RepID=A0ABS5BUW9_9BACT|nr:hypothetical protein [Gemmata palustris]MBP3957520.1 hypothetical protein [Gemmata palustris]
MAIDLYFGLTRGVPMAALECHTSAVNERINRGLQHLALSVGSDPERAAMSRRAEVRQGKTMSFGPSESC